MIVDSAPRYVRFECPDGDSTFSLHSIDEATDNNCVAVYFECDDVDAEYQRLSAFGIEFEHAPLDQDWLWREARLKDPDGNVLVLFAAGSNRKNPPWRAKSGESSTENV